MVDNVASVVIAACTLLATLFSLQARYAARKSNDKADSNAAHLKVIQAQGNGNTQQILSQLATANATIASQSADATSLALDKNTKGQTNG